MSDLKSQIAQQKDLVAKLKTEHPDWNKTRVPKVDEEIAKLKALIKQDADAAAPAKKAETPKAGEKKASTNSTPASKPSSSAPAAAAADDKHLLGITTEKEKNISGWFSEVIFKTEMVQDYPVSGCYILRPWSYSMWESIQSFMDSEIKKRGVKNTYFPMFIPEEALKKEKDHLEGFEPEVAWITRSGQSEMERPIAVRPTSETVMYPAFAQWIRSHRDLPLRVNQWCNIVRWEFKSPTPFLRTREFLWQEGHTAFASKKEAVDEVYDILNMYAETYKQILAVPVVKGTKTDLEKFAGGDFTTTCEVYIPYAGRGIQGCTSHHLGQNFAKMFDISFESVDKKKEMPYQNSWGFTTRSIGVAVMVHGDNKGLVLPPRVAPLHAVIITIRFKDANNTALDEKAAEINSALLRAGFKSETDLSDVHNPGFKRNHWELKGVPLRIELGPKDMEKQCALVCRRDTGEKMDVPFSELIQKCAALLDEIQISLYKKAEKSMHEHVIRIDKWEEFVPYLDKRFLVCSPWCGDKACEEKVKARSAQESKELAEKKKLSQADEDDERASLTSAAKSLCIPFAGQLPEKHMAMTKDQKCFQCGKNAAKIVLWGRSY